MSDTGAIGAKRRAGDDMMSQEGKRKKPTAKKPAFKPQPIAQPHSSDTPPEDELAMPLADLPPPPSERKPARRRPSMRAARPTSPQSPESPIAPPAAATNRKDRARSRSRAPSAGPTHSTEDPVRAELIASAPSAPSLSASISRPARINFNQIAGRASRPSMRPASPPRHLGGAAAPRQSMGPPSDVFTRKTRKSMGAGMLPPPAAESSTSQPASIGIGLPGGVLPTDVAVPLPESETPMIRKNKALREDQSRRSSLGMRGQRASTSLGRGDLSIPHRSVDPPDFYKHISASMPDPHRIRHLLVYCNKRAYDVQVEEGAKKAKGKSREKDKSKDVPRSAEGDKIVGDIMDVFLSGLGKGDVETNVFDTTGGSSKFSMLPHPRNKENREITAHHEEVIRKSKEENTAWKSIKGTFTKHQKATVEQVKRKSMLLETPEGQLRPDMTGAEGWLLQAVALADGIIAEGEGELADKGEFADVEFKIDMLNQATNAAVQYSTQATTFLDGIFTALSRDLQMDPAGASTSASSERSDTDGPDVVSLLSAATGVSSSGRSDTAAIAALASSTAAASTASSTGQASRPDPINMLRALAAADVRSGADQAARRAGAVAPVTASEVPAAAVSHAHGLSHSVGPGSGGGAGAGTAAMAMATPRSAPALRRGAPATGPGPTADPAAGTVGRDVPNTAAGVAGTGGLRGRMYGRGTGQQSSQ